MLANAIIYGLLFFWIISLLNRKEKEGCLEWIKTHMVSIIATIAFFWISYKIGEECFPPMKSVVDVNSYISFSIFLLLMLIVRIIYVKERRIQRRKRQHN